MKEREEGGLEIRAEYDFGATGDVEPLRVLKQKSGRKKNDTNLCVSL